MTRIAIAIAVAALVAALLLLADPAHSDGPPPGITPVLPPPVACGIPGWPPCFHYVYMPVVEVKR